MVSKPHFHRLTDRKTPIYLLFLLPGLIYLIINNYLPMFGIFIAFKKLNFATDIFHSPWVGLDNFIYLFKTKDTWIITRNTLLYNFVFIALGTLLYIAVAIMVFEISTTKTVKAVQSFLLLPYMISFVIVSYLVFAFLGYDEGIINNSFLEGLGLKKINWYSNKQSWPFILTIVFIWKYIGQNAIIYVATISGISPSLWEAASIDGATRWQQIRYVALPALRSTATILILMSIGRIFYSDFGLFYQVPMDSGKLYTVTQTIDTYVFRALMRSNSFEKASAAGLYQSVVGFVLVVLANFAVRNVDPENALF